MAPEPRTRERSKRSEEALASSLGGNNEEAARVSGEE